VNKISEEGLELIKRFEGLRLSTYTCAGGKLTIGYGHTGRDVDEDMTITEEEANDLLESDVKWAEGTVNKWVQVTINQNQFDALVSLIFNIGAMNFINSTLLKELNLGLYDEAVDQFLRWNRAKGRVLDALVKRRKEERDLFLSET
jgi:lysozyme